MDGCVLVLYVHRIRIAFLDVFREWWLYLWIYSKKNNCMYVFLDMFIERVVLCDCILLYVWSKVVVFFYMLG
jgi:hypothetical protein